VGSVTLILHGLQQCSISPHVHSQCFRRDLITWVKVINLEIGSGVPGH